MILYTITASCIGVFGWEYVAKRQSSLIKPSTALTYVADFSYDLFYGIGSIAAKLSSFLTLLNFNEVIETGHDIIKPVINMVISPYHMITGYINTSLLYDHPYMVAAGSLTLYYVYACSFTPNGS